MLATREAELQNAAVRMQAKAAQYAAAGGVHGPLAPLVRRFVALQEHIDMYTTQLRHAQGGAA